MGRTKKKFIDPKKSVSYKVVHRSQRDPLVADEDAPQRVLQSISQHVDPEEKWKRVEQQHAHGIYYDDVDEYDYLQHLKEPGEQTVDWVEKDKAPERQMYLPKVVFASEHQEKVGMLNLAAPDQDPKFNWDPEIVAALDEAVDFDDPTNHLDDDFFVQANKSPEAGDSGEEGDYSDSDWDSDGAMSDGYSDEERDELGKLGQFNGEETQSRFTSYSMTSSVIRRNELLSRLDDQFEKLYEKYDDDEIGAVDGEDIGGNMCANSELLLQLAEEYEIKKKTKHVPDVPPKCPVYEGSDSEEKEEIEINEGEKWDCESVLTTYSNIYNRPKLIEEVRPIKISRTTGIPMNVLHKTGLTAAALGELDKQNSAADGESVMSRQSVYSVLSLRDKHESPEERRKRKENIKMYRQERRLEKKMNTTAFKSEKKRQEKVVINLKNNLQGVKIV